MPRWCFLPAGLLLVFALAFAAPAATVTLRERDVIVTTGEARHVLPKDAESLLAVQNAPLRAVQLMPEEAASSGIEPGLYLFNAAGETVAFLADDSGVPCSAVALSPGGKVLAVDSGTWVVRSWSFYTYPVLKSLGGLTYLADGSPLVWHGDATVLVLTQEDVDQKRQCDYDPCGPISVERVDLWPFTATPLFKGSDLCDYTIERFTGTQLDVIETCTQSLEGWSQLNDPSRTTRTLTKNLVD